MYIAFQCTYIIILPLPHTLSKFEAIDRLITYACTYVRSYIYALYACQKSLKCDHYEVKNALYNV